MPATVLGRELALYLLAGKRSGFGHDLAIAWGFAAWGRSYVFGPFFFFFCECGDVICGLPSSLLEKAVEKLY